MADLLATPQDLASLLQVDYASLTAAQQATLLMLVELATSKVQRAAGGQRIVDITDTAVIDGVCGVWLELPQLPIRSVSLVKVDGTTITDWSLRRQKLWRAVGWLNTISPPSQITVTYAHGYLTGSQYLQLGKAMTLSLAKAPFTNPSGATSESIDDYRVSYAEADARMEMTEPMRATIADAYGRSTFVTDSMEDW